MKIRSNRRKRRRYGRRRSDRKVFYARVGLAALLLLTIVLILRSCISKSKESCGQMWMRPDRRLMYQLLDINEYSRPGIESDGITGIVIHYTANPGSTAQENRDYFEGLKDSHETSASSNLSWDWKGRSSSVCPHGRWHMHPTSGIRIPFRSNAVIRTKQESLQKKPISRWCS